MIRVNQVRMALDESPKSMKKRVAKTLNIAESDIQSLSIFRKSIDSRRKNDIHFSLSVDIEVSGNESAITKGFPENKVQIVQPFTYNVPELKRQSSFRPVVVGFGPAGMFAALLLAKQGLNPIILERGKMIAERKKDVDLFWQKRILNEQSNVQFGEGGAGTFSDGKLNTGIRDPRCRQILIDLVAHGAPEEILYNAKPHIGTDLLSKVVENIRKEIISLGGTFLFESTMTALILVNNAVHGLRYRSNVTGTYEDLETDCIIFAVGHSARDTVKAIYKQGIPMIRKPFSVGARIEHPQELINKAQYGAFANHPALGSADYKLSAHPKGGRGAYTFCMCPGGTVVTASSEEGGVVVNGMSEHARDKENANSAILVGIDPEHLEGTDIFAGFHLQRQMEEKAFALGEKSYAAPAQLVKDFLSGTPSKTLSFVNPSCPTGVVPSDLQLVLPQAVSQTMASAIIEMDKKLKGFALPDAVLTGVESRSSSPVRILRNEFLQSDKAIGFFPCGEGAGYAGGIVSSAVDGIKCAEAVLLDIKDKLVM